MGAALNCALPYSSFANVEIYTCLNCMQFCMYSIAKKFATLMDPPLHERSEVRYKRHVWSKNHSGCLETSCHVRGPVTPNFVLPGNGPADLIRLPEMVRRTESRCVKWSTGPFQAAHNGPTLPVLVR